MTKHVSNINNEIKDKSVFFPCDKYDQYPAACYRYMLPVIRAKLGVGRKKLTEECMKMSYKQRLGCFHGLGMMFMKDVARYPSYIKKLCQYGNSEDQTMCIEGVIEKLSEFDEEIAMKACSSLNGENAKICVLAAKEKMYRLDKPTMYLYRQ